MPKVSSTNKAKQRARQTTPACHAEAAQRSGVIEATRSEARQTVVAERARGPRLGEEPEVVGCQLDFFRVEVAADVVVHVGAVAAAGRV